MTLRLFLVALAALSLTACPLPSGVIGVSGDDDDDDAAAGDDDDAADDDDDAGPDDDDDDAIGDDDDQATPPVETRAGFAIWDGETFLSRQSEGAALYGVIGDFESCDDFFENDGYGPAGSVGLWALRAENIEFEGEYVDFYGDCRINQPDARCFTGWGDDWSTDEDDVMFIHDFGEVIVGTLSARGEDLGFTLVNCGEIDFDGYEYDGESAGGEKADPDGGSGTGKGRKWGLRFR